MLQETSGSIHIYISKSSHMLFLKGLNISLQNNGIQIEREVRILNQMNPKPCILQLQSFILTQNFEAKSAFLLTSKFQHSLQ